MVRVRRDAYSTLTHIHSLVSLALLVHSGIQSLSVLPVVRSASEDGIKVGLKCSLALRDVDQDNQKVSRSRDRRARLWETLVFNPPPDLGRST